MTKDDIIGMAVEAGFADAQGTVHAAYQLEAFANLVAAHKREWVGLTYEERAEVADVSDCFEDIVDATEAKLKEKNT
jgi:hypothetical protein